jgi:hypothetical protein
MTEAEELDLAKDAIRSLMENTLKQNGKMYRALKFYADRENWRNRMVHMDQGEKARAILGEVEG